MGVSNKVSEAELNAIANNNANNVFHINQYGSLKGMLRGITDRACNTSKFFVSLTVIFYVLLCFFKYILFSFFKHFVCSISSNIIKEVREYKTF